MGTELTSAPVLPAKGLAASVDGARYAAPGGMREHLPEGRPARRGERVIVLSTEHQPTPPETCDYCHGPDRQRKDTCLVTGRPMASVRVTLILAV
jgi:hypothetical protein